MPDRDSKLPELEVPGFTGRRPTRTATQAQSGRQFSPAGRKSRGVTPTPVQPRVIPQANGIGAQGRLPAPQPATPAPAIIPPPQIQAPANAQRFAGDALLSQLSRGLTPTNSQQQASSTPQLRAPTPAAPQRAAAPASDPGIRIIRGNFNGTGNFGGAGGFDVTQARQDQNGFFTEEGVDPSVIAQENAATVASQAGTAEAGRAAAELASTNPTLINPALTQGATASANTQAALDRNAQEAQAQAEAKAASIPDLDTFLELAAAANPDATDNELRLLYAKEYGPKN